MPAIVAAFALDDERTVSTWQDKAGQHAKRVQEAIVCQGQVDVGQVQGDEFYVKTQSGGVWVATAMCVHRGCCSGCGIDRTQWHVGNGGRGKVKAAAGPTARSLWATDGFHAWMSTILTVFRAPVYTGKPGRPALAVWRICISCK
ncbi:MAG: hypothetical protein R3E79_41635 [Caldilineaceae bacterium]